jgi:hypothetical protein
MSQIYPYSPESYDRAAVVTECAKLRNWHDQIFAYNKGRGFDIEVLEFTVPPIWCTEEFFEGSRIVNPTNTYQGVPANYINFTGFVDGVVLDNTFHAITMRNASGETPTHTYSAAREKLQSAGFVTVSGKILEANGWLAILQEFSQPAPTGVVERVLGIAYPALAESVNKANRATLVRFVHSDTGEVLPPPPTEISIPDAVVPPQVEPKSLGDQAPNGKALKFLLSGRFERPKAEYASLIEAAGHIISSQYDADVDVVVVPKQGSRTPWVQQAKDADKLIIFVDDLQSFL